MIRSLERIQEAMGRVVSPPSQRRAFFAHSLIQQTVLLPPLEMEG